MNRFSSRKFLVAVFGAVSYFVLSYWGIKVPEEILYLLLGWLGVEGARDIAYAVNHKETPKKAPPITPQVSPEAPCVQESVELKAEDMGGPPLADAVTSFQNQWRKSYVLTNPDNPEQVEKDYIGHYETTLEMARLMYQALRGVYPIENIPDPCRMGDNSYEARWLHFAQSELQIHKDFVAAIKKNLSMRYQLGGLGYLLHGTPWNEMPEWARLNLMKHVKTGE